MTELKDTQSKSEVNPNNGAKLPENNQGGSTQPQVPTIDEGKIYSQKEFDDNSANTRRATERETKRSLLAKLGLTLEDEDKLTAFKQAYENSLTDEEKRNTELANLQAEKLKLSQDLEEKDYTIKALIELTGKREEDVDKIVKMAKGLKTSENTIEDAIKEVISMVNIQHDTTIEQPNPIMPIGNQLQQPSTVVIDVQENPFKPGPTFNLSKQGKLLKENPELAKKLAQEAGVKLNF